MSGLSLITDGWICQPKSIKIVNKYFTPIEFKIEPTHRVHFNINHNNLYLDVASIRDKRLHVKINRNQINIKQIRESKINLNSIGA